MVLRPRPLTALLLGLLALLPASCGGSTHASQPAPKPGPTTTHSREGRQDVNVYSADGAGDLSPVVSGDPSLVYVPNSLSDTVTVISQRTMKVISTFPTGALPQHVTPSYDLRTLYVDNDLGNSLTPLDPRTGRPAGNPIAVEDPYNLYFTPTGRYAIVVAERLQKLDFRDPGTLRLVDSLSVPTCRGVDHMDFSADGRYAFASCEFSGRMIEVDLDSRRVIHSLVLGNGLTEPPGCQARSGRTRPVRRRPAQWWTVGDRPVGVSSSRIPPHRSRCARPLPEP